MGRRSTTPADRGATAPRSLGASTVERLLDRFGAGSLSGLVAKLVVLGFANALALYAIPVLAGQRTWSGLAAVVVATVAIDAVLLTRRAIPLKFLVPGLLVLLTFQVYPVIFNAYIAFTNYGTGNILTQAQAVERIIEDSLTIPDGAIRYRSTPLVGPDGQLALLLTDPDGETFLGTADGLTPLDPADITGEGSSVSVGDFTRMTLGDAAARQDEVLAFEVPTEDGAIRVQTFSAAARAEQRLDHDPATDTIVDRTDGTVYRPVDGTYTADDGTRLSPGFRVTVGWRNFDRILSSSAIRGPFFRVFLWTFTFATGSVLLTFVVGLGLALALNDPRVRGLKYYRAILIIPYALPSFMTALIWQGLLNTTYGPINRILGVSIPWLTSADAFGPNGLAVLPKLSVLLVNLWLGFPYMFLITTGALQAIPSDLREAAFVDGASGWQAFRRVTLPLLLVSTAPLLIASFAFNFNNFNTIFLLTGGGPPIQGAATPAGHTDILITYAYRLAFQTGRGQDFGLASAVSVLIFIMVAIFSAISFRRTRVLEELN